MSANGRLCQAFNEPVLPKTSTLDAKFKWIPLSSHSNKSYNNDSHTNKSYNNDSHTNKSYNTNNSHTNKSYNSQKSYNHNNNGSHNNKSYKPNGGNNTSKYHGVRMPNILINDSIFVTDLHAYYSDPNEVAHNKPMLRARTMVDDEEKSFTVLCDTGASTFNFISSQVARTLKLNKQKFKSKIRVRTANNQILRLSDYVILSEVRLEQYTHGAFSHSTTLGAFSHFVACATLKAVVIDTCPFDFILGYDDIYSHNIVTKFPAVFSRASAINSEENNNKNTPSSCIDDQGKPRVFLVL